MTDQTSSDRGCIPTSEPQLQSSYGAGRRAVTQHPPLKHSVRHVTPNNVGELGDPEAHFRCNLLSLVHLLAHGFRQMLHCGRLPPPHTDPWNFLQLLANPCPFALPQHLLGAAPNNRVNWQPCLSANALTAVCTLLLYLCLLVYVS